MTPRVVIVGGTGGIGRELVRRFTAQGAEVHAVARSRADLDDVVAETGCRAHELDAADGERVAEVLGGLGPVDVMVYTAGVGGSMSPFHLTGRDHITRSVEGNVLGLLYCAHAVLPAMVEQGTGHVVVIGSIAGLYPIQSATYGASKGAGHSFAQGLRLELKGTGVRVTEVSPGRVNTEFIARANADVADAAQPSVDVLLQPADVADAVMYAVGAPPGVSVGQIELMPLSQVVGGSYFVVPPAAAEAGPDR